MDNVSAATVTAGFARLAVIMVADGVPQTMIALGLVRTIEALPTATITAAARQAIAEELRRVADQITGGRA